MLAINLIDAVGKDHESTKRTASPRFFSSLLSSPAMPPATPPTFPPCLPAVLAALHRSRRTSEPQNGGLAMQISHDQFISCYPQLWVVASGAELILDIDYGCIQQLMLFAWCTDLQQHIVLIS